eukprot:Hpha_TRINITY_DN15315_c6_g1::TRINITY_DN15315_c6_g1_i1::g.91383::m.91383/K02218/CSNK1, CKI; casein kinase 1
MMMPKRSFVAEADSIDGRDRLGSVSRSVNSNRQAGDLPPPSPKNDGAQEEVAIADNRFVLKKKLGSGSFGDVYQGWDRDLEKEVAVKLEHVKARFPQLKNEVRILNLIGNWKTKFAGYTRLYWSGVEGDFSVMVMDYLGPSLENVFEYCNRKFSLKTTLMLGIQMLRRLEALHSVLHLHRDIKPENFVLGRKNFGHHVYLIDFGLAKRYWNPKTDAHCEYQDGKPLVGTARYTSLATHLGIEPSRRDDLEAVGYVLLYFIKGTLPWMGIKATGRDKIIKIGEKKESMSVETLTRGEHYCFRKYMKYVRTMKYDEQPDYHAMRRLFHRSLQEEELELDWQYDWMSKFKALKKKKKRRRKKREMVAGDMTGDGQPPTDTDNDDTNTDTSMMSEASNVSSSFQQGKTPRGGMRANVPARAQDEVLADSFLVNEVPR